MEGFFFGHEGAEIFAVRVEPTTTPRATGVVICPSWGMEYMRSHRGLMLLSCELAARGFEVLRFDYGATGDSAGRSGQSDVRRWTNDIGAATRELMALSGCYQIGLVGLRLGALLVSRAVASGLKCHRQVLLDPPGSGSQWLDQMRRLETAYYTEKNRYRTRRAQLVHDDDSLIGMPLPRRLAADIATLEGFGAADTGALHRVHSADFPDPTPADAEVLNLPDPGGWLDPDRLTSPWAPAPSITALADACARWMT